MDRRNFLAGIIAAATAPAFIKTAGLLMPIKPTILIPIHPTPFEAYAWHQQVSIWIAGEYTVEMRNEIGNARIS